MALSAKNDVILREFDASLDDDRCKELEKKATMIPDRLKWLVDGHTIHKANFDYKINMFPAGFIVVADSPSLGIVGMICGAIKEISLRCQANNSVKAVYIFDLRVAASHQKAGLGAQLLTEAHRRAEKLGAQYAYLTVNGDNEKAQRLFTKFGYTECSTRFPVGASFWRKDAMALQLACANGIEIKKIQGQDAFAMLDAELKGRDFAPADLQDVLRSDFYLGTYVASTGDSFASVSLWDGSGVTTFWISRFLFPAEWYANLWFVVGLSGIGLTLTGAWIAHVFRLFAAGSTRWFLGYSFLTAAVALIVNKLRPMLAFVSIMIKNKDGNMKTRGRFFAVVERGPQGMECLKAAVAHGKQELRRLGFLAWICNLDVKNGTRGAFQADGNFVAKLMHKSFAPAKENLPHTSPDDFHDPRDI
eukprot:TRINITY_DN91143_c0_g1_i1.p1 TRINITY_DN91143_c0_g1~~TRINITY_DN91143_c0_g1_i1.p1  ORF type:complete len:418 (+),score=68.78 TRINITY_DN91143_c0_g1_i1:54-1307(+)